MDPKFLDTVAREDLPKLAKDDPEYKEVEQRLRAMADRGLRVAEARVCRWVLSARRTKKARLLAAIKAQEVDE